LRPATATGEKVPFEAGGTWRLGRGELGARHIKRLVREDSVLEGGLGEGTFPSRKGQKGTAPAAVGGLSSKKRKKKDRNRRRGAACRQATWERRPYAGQDGGSNNPGERKLSPKKQADGGDAISRERSTGAP